MKLQEKTRYVRFAPPGGQARMGNNRPPGELAAHASCRHAVIAYLTLPPFRELSTAASDQTARGGRASLLPPRCFPDAIFSARDHAMPALLRWLMEDEDVSATFCRMTDLAADVRVVVVGRNRGSNRYCKTAAMTFNPTSRLTLFLADAVSWYPMRTVPMLVVFGIHAGVPRTR